MLIVFFILEIVSICSFTIALQSLSASFGVAYKLISMASTPVSAIRCAYSIQVSLFNALRLAIIGILTAALAFRSMSRCSSAPACSIAGNNEVISAFRFSYSLKFSSSWRLSS